MKADAQVADAVQLLGDRSRVAMLWALSDGRPVSASELARVANIRPSTASSHLSHLVNSGWVSITRQGRHRLFRLARPEVIEAMEALARISPGRPARTFREGSAAARVRAARTCYDHLAGRQAILIVDALQERAILRQEGDQYELGPAAGPFFADLGIDLEATQRKRRAFARACMDWSERSPHLAGALGAALLDRMFALGWIERIDTSRAVAFTVEGRQAMKTVFLTEA